MKLRVRYTATFEAVIDVGEHWIGETPLEDQFADEISDIEIPEGGANNSVYQSETFDVESVEVVDDWGLLVDNTNAKLRVLGSETTVLTSLLMENNELISMIERGASKAECLTFINENW